MKNKVVIITGASSGIGMALAEECSRKGAKLVLAARRRDKLKEVESRLKKENPQVVAAATDVSREDDCRALADLAVKTFGGIDVLINNAGISMRASFLELDLKVIREVMDVNFWGTVYCTKYALPWLLRSQGSLVGISSIAGYKGLPGRTGYSASKFALQGFLEVVRIENLNKGLHVLIACPGFTASNIRKTALDKAGNPQGESPREEEKMMSAQEVAARIVRAIEKRKRTLILTTQGKLTVSLNKFFPGFMDGMVYRHMSKEPDSPF
jgi:short-subunit dehydrogenase